MPVTQGTPEKFCLLVIALWCKLLRLYVTQALHGSLKPWQHRAAAFLYTAIGPVQSLLCDLAAGRTASCVGTELCPHPFCRFVNHARNVWDRAVTLLPRVDQLWYKYIHMEEMLGNVPAARQIFERWMQWEPDHHGWAAYVKVTCCTVP